MSKSGRDAALHALSRLRRSKAWSEDCLNSYIEKHELDRREAALASRLCYSVLQNMALCDFYINCYSSVKSAKLQPQVLDILRMSVCQILFFQQIPDRAAVSEAVTLCKNKGYAKASGLVNGVLRRISENRDLLPQVPGKGSAEYLAVRYSHPIWLVEEYLSQLGYESCEALLSCVNSEIAIAAQVNSLKCDCAKLKGELEALGVSVAEHPWMSDCLLLRGGGSLVKLPPFQNGEFYVQDPAARLAVIAGGIEPGMKVLDICAAPGGKSFSAAIMMKNRGKLVSLDINEKKLRRIESAAERLGLTVIETGAMDAGKP